MKVIVAGGRDFTNSEGMLEVLNKLVEDYWLEPDAELICGMARGADITAFHIFKAFGNPITEFTPDWEGLGKRAGFVRNQEMGDAADKLIAFWDGKSKGTKHMIKYMERMGKPVKVFMYTNS